MNATNSPRARSAPRFRAYAGPALRPRRRTTVSAWRAAVAAEVSSLASSTTISSYCSAGRSLALIAESDSRIVEAALYDGTTIESRGPNDTSRLAGSELISIPQREVREALQSHNVGVSLLHGQLSKVLGAGTWWRVEKLYTTCGSLQLVEIAGCACEGDHDAVNLLVARSGQAERQVLRVLLAIVTHDENQCDTRSLPWSVNLSGAPTVGYEPSDILRSLGHTANFRGRQRQEIEINPIFNVCVRQNTTSRLMCRWAVQRALRAKRILRVPIRKSLCSRDLP